MMSIVKTILNADNQFSPTQVKKISGAFLEAVRTVRASLKVLPNVNIVFYDNPDYVAPETGIGGNTDNEHLVFIPLDAKKDFNQRELLFVIRHELHHTVRIAKLGQTNSLLKKVISEGLADQFESVFDPKYRPITYRKDISNDDITKGLKDLKQIIKTGNYNYYEWFFGYNDVYPRWLGYTLGNMIIEKYLSSSNLSIADLVYTPADVFIPMIDLLLDD